MCACVKVCECEGSQLPDILLCDMACHTARHQEAEDLPHEMPERYPWIHSLGQAEECQHLEGDRGIAN